MTRSAFWLRILSAGSALLFSACSNLPTSGPTNDQVLEQIDSAKNPLGVRLVELTPAVVQTLRTRQEPSLSIIDSLRSNRPVDQLGPGDVLAITIYEAGNGLFSPQHSTNTTDNSAGPTPSSTAETLPRLQVDRNGMIMVPYAGEIHVSGQTATAVQRIIESRLAQKTSQAQVLVSVVTNGSNVAYVSGDVKNPGRYPLSLAHETLLDMIALAGGPTHSPQDTLVKVNRGQQEATTTLTRVQTVPGENIPVQPLDRIQFDYLPRSYLAFGASGKVTQNQFDAATVSLAEAVARVGGLDDNRANPEAVFLFRFERPGNAEALNLSPTGSDVVKSSAVTPGAMAQGIPIIYRVNMRDPQTLFMIQQFAMQDKDLIYIANAPTVQLYKFLQLIFTFTSPLITGAAVGSTF
jgi:polysaccharide export outer membrane protein